MNSQARIVDDRINHLCDVNCISWPAIFCGALVGVGLSFLVNLFMLSLGLSAFTLTTEGTNQFALGGFIILTLLGITAMFTAGWVSGYLGRSSCYKRSLGMIYGFITWSITLLISVLIATHTSHFVDNYSKLLDPNSLNYQSSEYQYQLTDANTSSKIKTEKTVKATGAVLLIIFYLFFLGAITCCIGSYFGLKFKRSAIT